MKRSPKSEFDDSGTKWFESPAHKEVKANKIHPGGLDSEILSETSESTFSRDEKELNIKLLKEKFYDFVKALSKYPELKIDYNYLNQNLTIKIDKILDIHSICEIFEKLCTRVLANPRIKKNWSEEETTLFLWVTFQFCHIKQRDFLSLEDSDWVYISSIIPGKKSEQCKYRWQSLLKVNLSKVPWTQKEDVILTQIIKEKGTKQWKDIAKELNARTGFKHYRHGKQCRERWINHLDPTINRGSWSTEEDIALLKYQLEMGKKWADIAKALGSRTENAVKNRWNSLIKKYRIEFGIEGDQIAAQTLLRKSNNYTTDEIERKICMMIIDAKERELNVQEEKINLKKIEESPLKSINEDFENPDLNIIEKYEEERPEKSRQEKKKIKKNIDVDRSKNVLRELINQERDSINNTSVGSPQNTNSGSSNYIAPNPVGMSNMNQFGSMKYMPFSNPFTINSMVPNPLLQSATKIPPPPAHSTNNIDANKLIAQQNAILNNMSNNPLGNNTNNPQNPLNNIFNLNDMLNLNILFLNSNNQLARNGSFKNNQANFTQQVTTNNNNPALDKIGSDVATGYTSSNTHSGTGSVNKTTFFNEDQPKKQLERMEEIKGKPEENISSKNLIQSGDDDKFQHIKLKQIPYNEFKINEAAMNDNQLYYAMVDLSAKQICYVAPVSRETAPPMMIQNKSTNPSMTFQPSPLYSPHPANFFSSPLVLYNTTNQGGIVNPTVPIKTMNKEFTNMHISKSVESSPEMSTRVESNRKENEWTPDIEPQKIFANLGARDQIPSGTFDYGTPDANSLFGKNSYPAFRRQTQISNMGGGKDELMKSIGLGEFDVDKRKNMDNNNALFERLKSHDSPSLFLNTSNRNI